MIACNHPMAFTEACLLACFVDRPLHFLVRGDVFIKRWQWFFRLTNQIPIYRFRDGFSNMRRNADSFVQVYKALEDRRAILIFPEGNTKLQKKLSPLQRGAAKIAFGAFDEREVRDIKIVPVGVNYDNGTAFRSDVFIKVGDALDVNLYLQQYADDQHKAIKMLTDDMYVQLRKLVIHIDNPLHEPLFNRISDVHCRTHPFDRWPVLDEQDDRFLALMHITHTLNEADPGFREDEIRGLLSHPSSPNVSFRFLKSISLSFFFPFALVGFVTNGIPFYLAKKIADKKVRQIEFYTPVRMGLLLVFYLLWMLITFLWLVSSFGWATLLLIWILPLSGYITILWFEKLREQHIGEEVWQKVQAHLHAQS